MNKRINVTIVLAVILCGLTACKPQSMEDAKPKNDQSHKTSHKSHEKVLKDDSDKTPAEIDQKESIAAEQIVVSISDDGFVTSHGDHYHFYNGEVPFDSLLSTELLASEDYQFDNSHAISDIQNGYILKVGETYYVYLKNQNHRDNLRTVPEE
ncbi:pneumococcal-type histidine triad protein [Streptococcus dysgalactiae subsp. equisimilis]|uniref:pneumococcal-type histidine triad protein n=1 Tax=Streptococcus dysgalactiae TaxID=1334 RepID=UPI003FD81EF8